MMFLGSSLKQFDPIEEARREVQQKLAKNVGLPTVLQSKTWCGLSGRDALKVDKSCFVMAPSLSSEIERVRKAAGINEPHLHDDWIEKRLLWHQEQQNSSQGSVCQISLHATTRPQAQCLCLCTSVLTFCFTWRLETGRWKYWGVPRLTHRLSWISSKRSGSDLQSAEMAKIVAWTTDLMTPQWQGNHTYT